jgi:hypothetical protein
MRPTSLLFAVWALLVTMNNGVQAMQFRNISPHVDSAGALHAVVTDESRALASTCEAPTKGIGCFDASAGMRAGVDALTDLAGGGSKVAGVIKDVLNPVLKFALAAVENKVFSSGFCFGEFSGSDILSSRPGSTLGNHACYNIPVVSDGSYLVTSLMLPAAPFMVRDPFRI